MISNMRSIRDAERRLLALDVERCRLEAEIAELLASVERERL